MTTLPARFSKKAADLAPIPYGKQTIDEADLDAVAAVLRSDWLTTGPAVDAFEDALQRTTRAEGAVVVSSGTAALHAAYAVAGVGPGRDLATSPLTFASTAYTALQLGARVHFVDVDDVYLTLDPYLLGDGLPEGTSVLTTVDYAGHPSDIPVLRAAVGGSITIVQDAAHSLGASRDGIPVGCEADLTTFSFHPVKSITTAEGGAVTMKDPRLTQPLREFRNHGMVRSRERFRDASQGPWHQEMQSSGFNYRLPDVLAALGVSQLRRLEHFIDRRNALATRYLQALQDLPNVALPRVRPGSTSAWHLFPIRILDGRRREVFEGLQAADIHPQVHYLPVHLHPLFEDLGYRRGMCPVAESAYEELLSLPLFPTLTEANQDRVIERLTNLLT